MINVEINGKLVGQCESAGKASSPLFKDVIDPWIEIRGFIASSPSLTDDQQVVLEWFKNEKKDQPFATVADFFTAYFEGAESEVPLNTMVAFEYLTNEQQFQVLAAFAEWGLKEDNQ